MSKESGWEWVPLERGVAIFRRPKSRCWYINIEQAGKLRRYSLRTKDRKSAIAIAQEKAKDFLVERHGVPVGETRIIRAAALYLRDRFRKRRRISTARIRYSILRDLVTFMDDKGILALGSVRYHHLNEFIIWRKDIRKLKAVTSNRDVIWVRAFFKWSTKHDLLRVNPALALETEVVEVEVKYTPEIADVSKMIDHTYTDTIQDLIVFIVNVGCRISEALTLRKEKVVIKSGTVILKRSKNHAEKTYKLNAPAVAILKRRYLAMTEFIFPTENNTKLSRSNVARAMRTACDNAKIQRITPHALRRTWLTFVRPVLGDKDVLEMGGWSSAAMLKYYDGNKVAKASPVVLTRKSV